MTARSRLVAVVVCLALGAGACASDDPPAAAPDTVADATIVASDGTTTTTTLEVTTTVVDTTVVPTSATERPVPRADEPPLDDRAPQAGSQRLRYEVGPLLVKSGQNNIALTMPGIPKPESGWITRIDPDLRLADGSVPAVDVIHLHHGVWLNIGARDVTARGAERFFAACEEKTITLLPDGYGYPVQAEDVWILNS